MSAGSVSAGDLEDAFGNQNGAAIAAPIFFTTSAGGTNALLLWRGSFSTELHTSANGDSSLDSTDGRS
jgi:hypothetical protein